MPFERFDKPGERFSSKISVWKQGVIHISKGTINYFALQGLDFCNLHFDREQRRVGLQFTGTPGEGSVKLSYREAGAVIPAKSFFDFYKVSYTPSRQYRIEQERQSGLLVFELAAPVEEYQEHPDGDTVEMAVRVVRKHVQHEWHLTAEAEARLCRYLFEAAMHCNWDEPAMEEAFVALFTEEPDGAAASGAGALPRQVFDIVSACRKQRAGA